MDIEEAKKIINKRTERLLEEFKIEKEVEPEDEPKIAYLMQEIRANKTVLNELDKKDKDIAELKQDIKEVMGKDRDCLTFGYHSAYVGLLDDLINIIKEENK